jgi:hypothetical protein
MGVVMYKSLDFREFDFRENLILETVNDCTHRTYQCFGFRDKLKTVQKNF